jgi:hypothetical protein
MMKKLVAVISLLLVLTLVVPCLPVTAEPLRLPHENPETASSQLDSSELLLSLGKIYNSISSREYRNAQETLEELKKNALPPDLQEIVDRYLVLTTQITANLNNVESFIDAAKHNFSTDNPAYATTQLTKAKSDLDNTVNMLTESEAVIESLGEYFDVFSGGADGLINQAYEQLNANLERVGQLSDELDGQREKLIENPESSVTTSFFYTTSVEFSAPAKAHPGISFIINGKIESTGNDIGRIIRILLDGDVLTEEFVMPEFSLEVTLPPAVTNGMHALTVSALSQEPYAGASTGQKINVTRIPVTAEIKAPGFAVLPGTVQVSGRIYNESGAFQNASSSIIIGKKIIPVTVADDSSFSVPVNLSLGFSLTGLQDLTLDIKPADPWYETVTIDKHLFILNPLLVAGLLIIIAAAIFFFLRSRKHIPAFAEYEEKPYLSTATVASPTLIPARRTAQRLTGVKARIMAAYADALETVVKVTGKAPGPNVTLREYAGKTILSPRGAVENFTGLTALAEAVLYSTHELDEGAATAAVKMAGALKKELSDGTP